jgi:hypothetical protein
MSSLIKVPEQYRQTILDFLMDYWQKRVWELQTAVSDANAFQELANDGTWIWQSDLAQNLQLIALAATGEVGRGYVTLGRLAQSIHDLLSRLFVPPDMGHYLIERYIPKQLWYEDLGQMVARAQRWLLRDELISLSQAAELLDVHVSAIRNRIYRRTLTPYYDPDAANPQRFTTFVLRSEVEALRQKKEVG